MTYVKEDAYLALKSELDSFKSEVKELKATVAQRALHGSSGVATKRATTPILGDRARDITLVYRLRVGGNPTSPLPPDFLSDEHWNFVDIIGPKYDPGVDFSGHIGEIRFTGTEVDNLPVNWAVCNGQIVELPDGSKKTLPNMQDKFFLASNEPGLSQGGSDTLKTGIEDRNHTHGVNVQGTTHGATLSVGQLAAHRHRVGINDLNGAAWHGNPDANPGTYWHLWTDHVGGNQPHAHGISFGVTSGGISQDHAHEVTLSETNRPPYVKLRPIMRFF